MKSTCAEPKQESNWPDLNPMNVYKLVFASIVLYISYCIDKEMLQRSHVHVKKTLKDNKNKSAEFLAKLTFVM